MINDIIQNVTEFFTEYGTWGLFLLSFIESSFFPIPPDILLIAMSLAAPHLALWYAFVTTVASVLGGMFGYVIGAKAGRPLLQRWVSPQQIDKIDCLYQRYGGWAVAIAGFTPIPYKLFTISAGVCGINKTVFIIASILSRGARFFLEGTIIFILGAKAKYLLENYFEVITLGIAVLVVLCCWCYKNKGKGFSRNLWGSGK
ncbi:MAG: YqaA family protein [Bacillota bacterium]